MESIYTLKIFNWIEKELIDSIISKCDIETFSPWEIIFYHWEESNGKAYIIKNWEIKVERFQVELAILKQWDMFWEIALLNEETRTATIIASTSVELIVLTMDNLFELIDNNSDINKEIIKRIESNLLVK